jgi:hypothetical protein
MGFWFWFWLWAGLILGALIAVGLIGKSLFDRALSAGHQASRLAEKAALLSKAIEAKPKLSAPESSVLADPAVAQARLRALQKAKIKKQEQRQRRLIKSLKRFDPNESRFH